MNKWFKEILQYWIAGVGVFYVWILKERAIKWLEDHLEDAAKGVDMVVEDMLKKLKKERWKREGREVSIWI